MNNSAQSLLDSAYQPLTTFDDLSHIDVLDDNIRQLAWIHGDIERLRCPGANLIAATVEPEAGASNDGLCTNRFRRFSDNDDRVQLPNVTDELLPQTSPRRHTKCVDSVSAIGEMTSGEVDVLSQVDQSDGKRLHAYESSTSCHCVGLDVGASQNEADFDQALTLLPTENAAMSSELQPNSVSPLRPLTAVTLAHTEDARLLSGDHLDPLVLDNLIKDVEGDSENWQQMILSRKKLLHRNGNNLTGDDSNAFSHPPSDHGKGGLADLTSMSPMEIKRQEHMYEFIASEAKHCQVLAAIKRLFADDMRDRLHIARDVTDRIFPGLDALIEHHFPLLAHLRSRQMERTDGTIDTIADILVQRFATTKSSVKWKATYSRLCASHHEAVAAYKDLMRNDRRFQAFVRDRTCHPSLKKKGVPECILFLSTRLTKYPLMLEPMMKAAYAVDRLDEVHRLMTTNQSVKEMLVHVNNQVAAKDQRQRMRDLLRSIDFRASAANVGAAATGSVGSCGGVSSASSFVDATATMPRRSFDASADVYEYFASNFETKASTSSARLLFEGNCILSLKSCRQNGGRDDARPSGATGCDRIAAKLVITDDKSFFLTGTMSSTSVGLAATAAVIDAGLTLTRGASTSALMALAETSAAEHGDSHHIGGSGGGGGSSGGGGGGSVGGLSSSVSSPVAQSRMVMVAFRDGRPAMFNVRNLFAREPPPTSSSAIRGMSPCHCATLKSLDLISVLQQPHAVDKLALVNGDVLPALVTTDVYELEVVDPPSRRDWLTAITGAVNEVDRMHVACQRDVGATAGAVMPSLNGVDDAVERADTTAAIGRDICAQMMSIDLHVARLLEDRMVLVQKLHDLHDGGRRSDRVEPMVSTSVAITRRADKQFAYADFVRTKFDNRWPSLDALYANATSAAARAHTTAAELTMQIHRRHQHRIVRGQMSSGRTLRIRRYHSHASYDSSCDRSCSTDALPPSPDLLHLAITAECAARQTATALQRLLTDVEAGKQRLHLMDGGRCLMNQQLVDLKSYQDKIEADKAEWKKQQMTAVTYFRRQDEIYTRRKAEIESALEDVKDQRDQLYRKLERLKTQGIEVIGTSVAVGGAGGAPPRPILLNGNSRIEGDMSPGKLTRDDDASADSGDVNNNFSTKLGAGVGDATLFAAATALSTSSKSVPMIRRCQQSSAADLSDLASIQRRIGDAVVGVGAGNGGRHVNRSSSDALGDRPSQGGGHVAADKTMTTHQSSSSMLRILAPGSDGGGADDGASSSRSPLSGIDWLAATNGADAGGAGAAAGQSVSPGGVAAVQQLLPIKLSQQFYGGNSAGGGHQLTGKLSRCQLQQQPQHQQQSTDPLANHKRINSFPFSNGGRATVQHQQQQQVVEAAKSQELRQVQQTQQLELQTVERDVIYF